MIVEFSVGNYRSIKDVQTISFVATGLKSPEGTEIDLNNIIESDGVRLLKTIGVYGPNASGKSNIVKALSLFLFAVRQEANSNSNLGDLCEPFLYQQNANETESYFQIVIIIDNKKFRYGFTVKRNINQTVESVEDLRNPFIITNEWLFGTKDKNVVEYFTREGNDVNKTKLPNADKIPDLPYQHTLYLNHVAAYDNESDCVKIKNFIRSRTISSFQDIMGNSLILANKENEQSKLLGVLSAFNLHYKKIRLNKEEGANLYENTHDKIYLTKTFIDETNHEIEVELNLENNESDGTRKMFDLAGLIHVAFNSRIGGLIIIDEIDSNFHPALLRKLIEMFNNPEVNKSNTQLIFTSHDTNLMSPNLMRRDQFYLAEKKLDESTRLYSLADLRGIRNTADFAKEYLAGMYGALPVLEDFKSENLDNNE